MTAPIKFCIAYFYLSDIRNTTVKHKIKKEESLSISEVSSYDPLSLQLGPIESPFGTHGAHN